MKPETFRKIQAAVEQALDEAQDAQWFSEDSDGEMCAKLVVEVLSDPMYFDSLEEFMAELEAGT